MRKKTLRSSRRATSRPIVFLSDILPRLGLAFAALAVPGCHNNGTRYVGGFDAPISIGGGSGTGGMDAALSTGGTSGASSSPMRDGASGGCVVPSTLPFGAVVIENFDQGPAPRAAKSNVCMMASPTAVGLSQCDFVGQNSLSCNNDFYCDVADGITSFGTVCPSYVQDKCGSGYFLRLFYDVDRQDGAFAGITFNISSKQNSSTCLISPLGPVDLTHFDYLSMRVRPGDAKGNAEVAIQDLRSGDNTYTETNPKMVLVSFPVNSNGYVPQLAGRMLPQEQWTEVQIKVCDLLSHAWDDGGIGQLDRTAISKVLVGFAKRRFREEQTDVKGPRRLDIDDIMLLPCPAGHCQPCP